MLRKDKKMVREYIKKIIHECIEGVEEDNLVSVKELHEITDQFCENYGDKIGYDPENSGEYYLFVDDYSLGHPAHILLIVMTLLFAGVKKIWVECYRSYEDEELFVLHHKMTKCLLDEVINRFPQLLLRKNIPYEKVQTSGIEFVNQNRQIDHVVLLGGYSGAHWKIARLREDVAIHLPSAVHVWVDYSSKEKMYQDDSLITLGRYGWNELYDYKCDYCKNMKYMDSLGAFIGLGYNSFWDWEEYVLAQREERAKIKNMTDILPLYLFGDENHIEKCLKRMPVFFNPILAKDFSTEKIDYNFLNLLKK